MLKIPKILYIIFLKVWGKIMQNKDWEPILEQYKNYTYSKEEFTNRTFAANRYYMGVCMVLLLASYILTTFTPASLSVLVASFLGILVSVMWWLNVDTYNIFIKVKYKNVLERLEENLPKSPFKEEFEAFSEVKNRRFTFVFADVQKIVASIMFLAFLVTLVIQIVNFAKFYTPHFFN